MRSEQRTVFSSDTLRNPRLWAALGLVLGLQVLAVHVGPVQSIFGTTGFSIGDWVLCAAVASSVFGVEEIRKIINRRTRPPPESPSWNPRRSSELR